MNDLEQAVISLVRMGLQQDVEAIRQYARRLLRRAPAGEGEAGDFREGLGEVLLDSEPVAAPALRRGIALAPAEPDALPWGGSYSGGVRSSGAQGSLPTDTSTAMSLVRVEANPLDHNPILAADVRAAVDALLEERRMAATLREHGVSPSRTVLITGAPGVGKTMTARSLAAAIGIPLVSVDLAAVVSSFLGRTGQNLRQVLDFARSRPCVLLLDEFDALAKRRDDQTDVGELKRIVNVLLLELERWPDDGLLVAATNHPELLDRAIWRRFDLVISLGEPDLNARRQIITDLLNHHTNASRSLVSDMSRVAAAIELSALAMEGTTGSDVAGVVRAAVRAAALTNRQVSDTLAATARARLIDIGKDPIVRVHVAELARGLGWTQRDIAAVLGVSHVTIGNWLRDITLPKDSDSVQEPEGIQEQKTGLPADGSSKQKSNRIRRKP